jgi:TatD DNase family protein
LDVLEELKIKNAVLHCFGGNMRLVKRAEELGFYFSIPPVITRLNHFQEIVSRVSLNKLLTETDAPYLSPYVGQRNEPSYVKETIKIIAKIKNVTEEEAEKIIFSNYQKIFLKK